MNSQDAWTQIEIFLKLCFLSFLCLFEICIYWTSLSISLEKKKWFLVSANNFHCGRIGICNENFPSSVFTIVIWCDFSLIWMHVSTIKKRKISSLSFFFKGNKVHIYSIWSLTSKTLLHIDLFFLYLGSSSWTSSTFHYTWQWKARRRTNKLKSFFAVYCSAWFEGLMI